MKFRKCYIACSPSGRYLNDTRAKNKKECLGKLLTTISHLRYLPEDNIWDLGYYIIRIDCTCKTKK